MTDPKVESFLSVAIAKSRTSSELSTSSEEPDLKRYTDKRTEDSARLEAEHLGWKEIHGFRGNKNWNAPYQLKNDTNQPLGYAAKHSRNNTYEDE